ncbi:hypothetical protein [Streptomyces broussonetiae]|uniref:Ribbon-helix-helix protein, CopG family n=1 Tax=Streptomyces broussonetiae TaxID=2686304 RepID=A0ABV5EF39_9ACTN
MAEKVKFSVSVDADLGEALRRCAEEEDEQISMVVSRALEEYLGKRRRLREGRRAMEEHFEEHGWPTSEELAEADTWVDDLFGGTREERRSA